MYGGQKRALQPFPITLRNRGKILLASADSSIPFLPKGHLTVKILLEQSTILLWRSLVLAAAMPAVHGIY